MYKIIRHAQIAPNTYRMEIQAPLIANKAQPGQFIILRVSEQGERIPLTIADADKQEGGVSIIYLVVGMTTNLLSQKQAGEYLHDFAGPLGTPSHLPQSGRVACVGGGVGTAVLYPLVKELVRRGVQTDVVIGARNKELLILEKELKALGATVYATTDDGSYGRKGLVTDQLKDLIGQYQYDEVIAIGPIIMMKFVSLLTKEYGIKTTVSMNPIMIDGTGMCGGCRLTVGGKTMYACVDGPDFDGHLVDFDEAMRRQTMYKPEEADKSCRLLEGELL